MIALLLYLAALLSPVPPYGGCDEAYLYPDTPGHTWCSTRGYLG